MAERGEGKRRREEESEGKERQGIVGKGKGTAWIRWNGKNGGRVEKGSDLQGKRRRKKIKKGNQMEGEGRLMSGK